jgi:hypothetical protein
VKEWSRQISELNQDDFSLLHTAAALSGPLSSTCDVSIATSVEGAVCEQLFSLVEKLRSVESTTSDSGAVSDYSEKTDCNSHSITSLDCFEDSDSCHRDSKATLGVNNNKDASSSELNKRNTSTDLSIKEQGKLSQQKEEEQLPATENTFIEPESKQPPSSVTDCDKSTDELTDSSAQENAGELLDKVATETTENKREMLPDEQLRIRRKTKRYYGHGYNNWRRGCGYYDNGRSRNSYQDNSRNRGQQRTYTSSSRHHEVQNQSSFNHEEVAAFLWDSKELYKLIM